MNRTVSVCLWSGPRNVSTALLYSFAQRGDTRAVDEPLYAHYLRVTSREHPGREEVLRAQDADGERVVRELILGRCDAPILFSKNMAHHLVGLDRGFLAKTVNVILTRDPEQMLPSLARQLARPELLDTSLALQTELLDQLIELGQSPPVLDSRELQNDPEGVLTALCAAIEIPFDPAMLRWSAGPKPMDGVWGKHWYDNVWRSTEFTPYQAKTAPFPEELRPLLAECQPHYERLRERAIRAQPARRDGV